MNFKLGAWGSISVALLAALAVCAIWIYLCADATELRTQWIVIMAVFVALCIVVGVLVNGRPDGILIDDSNRISLERTQWVAWLIVLLSGYFVEAVWNVLQAAAFPTMQTDLFALLGIVSVSPVISNVIVDSKKQQPAPAAATQAQPPAQLAASDQPLQKGTMDVNASPSDAGWRDLYLGEEAANRYVVDISRLQKLIITVLLVFAYTAALWKYLGTTPGPTDLNMPPVGRDFLALLGISHGAYLASKATTKTPT